MSALHELSEQCERSSFGSESLNRAIGEATGIGGQPGRLHGESFTVWPNFTASLDAAMLLVPDGYDWIIGRTNSGLTVHAEVGGRGDEFMRFAATPALALCAAALRAIRIDARSVRTTQIGLIRRTRAGAEGIAPIQP